MEIPVLSFTKCHQFLFSVDEKQIRWKSLASCMNIDDIRLDEDHSSMVVILWLPLQMLIFETHQSKLIFSQQMRVAWLLFVFFFFRVHLLVFHFSFWSASDFSFGLLVVFVMPHTKPDNFSSRCTKLFLTFIFFLHLCLISLKTNFKSMFKKWNVYAMQRCITHFDKRAKKWKN